MEKSNFKKKMAVVVMSLGLLTGGIFAGQELAKDDSPVVRHAATTTKFKTKTYQTTANLIVRSGASTKYKAITKIPKGAKVTSSLRIGNWYKVTYKGKTGYSYGSYLKEVKASTVSKNSSTSVSYKTTRSLALKSGRSTKYKTLTTIPKGKSVKYVKAYGSWTKVSYGSKTGYVPTKYISKGTTASKPSTSVSYKTTRSLALKSGRSSKYKTLTTIPKGKSVTFVKAYGSWTQVKYGAKTGYVPTKYVYDPKKVKPTPTPKPTNNLSAVEKAKLFETVFKRESGSVDGQFKLNHTVKQTGDVMNFGSSGMVFSENRGVMFFDRTNYNAAYERSDVFGKEVQEEYKLWYDKYNSAIKVYVTATAGAGHYDAFRKEFEKFAYNAGSGKTIVVKTFGGKAFEFEAFGSSLRIETK
ncbi:SH3 domain-containing protein [Exiguobacterium sp. s163]|uniref:SH3 domain-containing protein n=1 Tax=Exiguobacterium sp. s163 TaxID=2751287 RepID=UPI001BE53E94|nr:SH3 domain-containing protein [Exiguobacterium sp. s163]